MNSLTHCERANIFFSLAWLVDSPTSDLSQPPPNNTTLPPPTHLHSTTHCFADTWALGPESPSSWGVHGVAWVCFGSDNSHFKQRLTLLSPWRAYIRAFVAPSCNTPPYQRCSPSPPLTNMHTSVGCAQSPHRLVSLWSYFSFTLQTVYFALFRCTNDVMFVTYKNMLMGPTSTRRVRTPPRYATIPILLCVHTVSIFLKTWWNCVSTSPKSSTVDLHIARHDVVLLHSLNLLYYNDVSGATVPQGVVPLPTHLLRCHGSLLALAVLLVSSHMCGLGLCPFSRWVCDLLTKGCRGPSPKCELLEEHLVSLLVSSHMCGLSLRPFSRLVCDLLPKGGRPPTVDHRLWPGLSPKGDLPDDYLVSSLANNSLTYPGHGGGAPFHRALCSLVVRVTWLLGPVTTESEDACQPTNTVNCFYPLSGWA